MLNKIGDEAAENMLAFYQSHLTQNAIGEGKYEAHFNIALLTWRKFGQQAIADIIFHFREAAKVYIPAVKSRDPGFSAGRESLFNFMFPLLITYIFGEKSLRQELSSIKREQWAPADDEEYLSLILFFDLLRAKAIDRQFNEQEIASVEKANASFITHSFYQPWIAAFLNCIRASLTQNSHKLEQSLAELIELHREEALYGTWSTMPEGLFGFWPLAAKITAEINNQNIHCDMRYMPAIDIQLIP